MAALLSYYGFFSLFPLLMVATTLLARILREAPDLQARLVDSALRNLPLIGPRIGRDLGSLDGGGLALGIAIGLSLWSGLGAVKAFQHAMNTVWNVPYRRRPSFVSTNARALVVLVLGALLVVGSAAVAALVASASGWVGAGVGWLLATLVNTTALLCIFKVSTATHVRWTELVPGAVAGGLAWTVLLAIGGLYVERQLSGASEVYGTFALVIGLLAWLYLGANLVLYAAEINVVHTMHLWPRSLIPPPLTDADERVLIRYASEAERRPEVVVHAHRKDDDQRRRETP